MNPLSSQGKKRSHRRPNLKCILMFTLYLGGSQGGVGLVLGPIISIRSANRPQTPSLAALLGRTETFLSAYDRQIHTVDRVGWIYRIHVYHATHAAHESSHLRALTLRTRHKVFYKLEDHTNETLRFDTQAKVCTGPVRLGNRHHILSLIADIQHIDYRALMYVATKERSCRISRIQTLPQISELTCRWDSQWCHSPWLQWL